MPLGPDPERAALDARVVAWTREPLGRAAPDDARFDALARALFAHQFARCAPYRRFCRARSRTPETVLHWTAIPAVPAGAFKELELISFAGERKAHVFRTSGTETERRGELWLDTLAIYEASLLPTFERHVLPDLADGERMRMLVLAPSVDELPDSSLSHMFAVVLAARGDAGSGWFVEGGTLRTERLRGALADASRTGTPVAVLATAFALVHLLEAMEAAGERVALPQGSRAMETGGFKGRAREIGRDVLYRRIEERLGIPQRRIVNQYGMTELASQFYDSVLAEPSAPRRKLGPPWARVRILDPATGRECAPGEVGAITIHDLANTGSVLAIQTADLGRKREDGFELLGREPGAEARGCSIAADAMLEGAVP